MGLPTSTWLLIGATFVPFVVLELVFFVRFGRWLRARDEQGRE
jgi:hypothetical protein